MSRQNTFILPVTFNPQQFKRFNCEVNATPSTWCCDCVSHANISVLLTCPVNGSYNSLVM